MSDEDRYRGVDCAACGSTMCVRPACGPAAVTLWCGRCRGAADLPAAAAAPPPPPRPC